jgi:aromatic ring-opening dioxygenase LigB subunit
MLLLQIFHMNSGALSKVVHASVIPHGDFVYDPSLVHNQGGSLDLHGNATLVGDSIAKANPSVIVLITPHGLEDDNDFILYMNSNASGFAQLGQDLHNASFPGYKVPLSVKSAPAVTKALVTGLGGHSSNMSSLLAFADGEPIALRWGEVIPLTFIRHYLEQV